MSEVEESTFDYQRLAGNGDFQSKIIVDENRYFLLDCSTKQPIGDLRNGMVRFLRLRNKTLQDMVDLSWGLGKPVNVHEKGRSDSLMRKLTPTPSKEQTETINGAVFMSHHTENLSHIKTPNFVALYCERKDQNNQGYTLVSDLDAIIERLSPLEIDILSAPKFTVEVEDTLNFCESSSSSSSYAGEETERRRRLILPNKVPVFRDGMIFFDQLYMTPDADALNAFERLKNVIVETQIQILLEPGDIFIFDNLRCVHGRGPFNPLFDGNDRCLYRLLILDDLKTHSAFEKFASHPPLHQYKEHILPTDNQLMVQLASLSIDNCKSQLKKLKRVCIFEVEGGLDKHRPPHRREIHLLQEAFFKRGIRCEIVFYKDEESTMIENYVVANFDFCLTRVNPEFYPSYTEWRFLRLLRNLESRGVQCLPTSKTITVMDSKSIVHVIKDTVFGRPDTHLYTSKQDFIDRFVLPDGKNARVIKSDHKAEGRGVFLVSLKPSMGSKTQFLDVIEASNNEGHCVDKVELAELLFADNAQVLDQRYYPKIKEMEIRAMLIEKKILYVILFIPTHVEWLANGDGLYFEPSRWPKFCAQIEAWLPKLEFLLARRQCKLPFLWSADFILDGDSVSHDWNMDNVCEYADQGPFVLSEINCSCLGFRQNVTQPNVAEDIAQAILEKDL